MTFEITSSFGVHHVLVANTLKGGTTFIQSTEHGAFVSAAMLWKRELTLSAGRCPQWAQPRQAEARIPSAMATICCGTGCGRWSARVSMQVSLARHHCQCAMAPD